MQTAEETTELRIPKRRVKTGPRFTDAEIKERRLKRVALEVKLQADQEASRLARVARRDAELKERPLKRQQMKDTLMETKRLKAESALKAKEDRERRQKEYEERKVAALVAPFAKTPELSSEHVAEQAAHTDFEKPVVESIEREAAP